MQQQNLMPMSRLRWACRRGMLELDLILERFLAAGYDNLSLQQKLLFQEFLDCSDQELYSWLIKREVASDKKWHVVIKLILPNLEF